MKTRFRVLAMCGLLTSLSAATLGAAVGDLKVVVPFGFSAGNTKLSAGSYRVSSGPTFQGLLSIRGGHGGAFVLSPAPESAEATATAALVFNRYGDRYFLRQVRFGDRRSFALPATMEEREASMPGRGMQAAMPEVVTLQAARLAE